MRLTCQRSNGITVKNTIRTKANQRKLKNERKGTPHAPKFKRPEKKTGKAPLTKDQVIDHKNPIRKGGTNAKGNVKVTTRKKNAAWRKGKKGYDR